MANHVYRVFARDDLLHTTVHASPLVQVMSGAAGWTGNTNLGTNALSLYGGVRSRADVQSGSTSGIQVYPLDFVDTHSIDKVIGVPGQYPQTGSINVYRCSRTEGVPSKTWLYDEHWSAINNLSAWYHSHKYSFYHDLDALPTVFTVFHVPEMFYGRRLATGSIKIETHAWDLAAGTNFASGTRYYVDDGYGRLFDVPQSLTGSWRDAWMSGTARDVGRVFYDEGLVLLTHPSASWHAQFAAMSFNNVPGNNPTLKFEFRGSTIMKSFVFMCRMGPADANASNNPTWVEADAAGKQWTVMQDGRTYITAIGIYNEERQLVAVAKLAQPIRKREQDNLDIRLRLDI